MLIGESKAILRASSALLRHPEMERDVAGALGRRRFGDAARMARAAARRPDVFAEKIVSRKYKFLWLCNPKVASRSIIVSLLILAPFAASALRESRRLRPPSGDKGGSFAEPVA